jgi:hypothetical protein
MAKLVTIESGSIVPLPGTSEPYDGGMIITNETKLIIDGNNLTLIHDDGLTSVMENHQLELNKSSNYKEQPLFKKTLFFIMLRDKAARLWLNVKRPFIHLKSFIIRTFQTIFRKSHISNYDLMDLDSYLAKCILPKIKAYRKRYLEREVIEVPNVSEVMHLLSQEGYVTSSYKEMDEEMKAWVTVMDEIIFAMRWRLEVHGGTKEIEFFKEYYGQFIAYEDDKDKHFDYRL